MKKFGSGFAQDERALLPLRLCEESFIPAHNEVRIAAERIAGLSLFMLINNAGFFCRQLFLSLLRYLYVKAGGNPTAYLCFRRS